LSVFSTTWAGDYENGIDAYERGDYITAIKEFRRASAQGNTGAQTYLGSMYADGQGVAQDYAEAAKWYRLAAEQGNPWAQALLGMLYAHGQGVTKDPAEAVKWYRLGAQHGNVWAQSISMPKGHGFALTPYKGALGIINAIP